VNRKLSSAILW